MVGRPITLPLKARSGIGDFNLLIALDSSDLNESNIIKLEVNS